MKILEIFKKNYFVCSAIFLSFILIIASFLNAIYRLRNISQPLIIHFSDGTINKIGNLNDIYYLGIFSLLILLINFFLVIYLEKRDDFLSKLLASATLFFAILIFILFSVIVSVNI